ncbi:TetR family transcriptional regulator [Primorskyibacter flagellatus]|uniref:TetR family transcriptional regulator n=1 Tax=Primorskyibacter flagellatus TaxID=1387277 RepID=A0A917A4M2_9RHOB|nr:TetR/AcrR family transcriptional regulator [Primorskyibacter flagellatus]GGE23290.1 TetR family transcriptional regulator [Primorskyibacter flagellatus]
MSQEETPPRRGRPPSDTARRKALSAARAILTEEGFGRLSVEAVAARSGVGKPTIYRHWANAQQLALAALMPEDVADAETRGDVRRVLTDQMRRLTEVFATRRGRQIAVALAAADPDSEMTRAFRSQVILKSRAGGRAVLERAIAGGELTAPADMETLLDMIYGPLVFRVLLGHAPLSDGMAEAVVSMALAGLAPPQD